MLARFTRERVAQDCQLPQLRDQISPVSRLEPRAREKGGLEAPDRYSAFIIVQARTELSQERGFPPASALAALGDERLTADSRCAWTGSGASAAAASACIIGVPSDSERPGCLNSP